MGFSLEFLGSGTSTGVPCIACDCAVCTSDDSRNKRLRCAALVKSASTHLLVDTGPDFRQQMLRARPPRLDGVLITHYHADHVVGIDDLRRFNLLQESAIDLWADAPTLARLRQCFDYVFSDRHRPGLPSIIPHTVEREAFTVGAVRITPVALDHQIMESQGFIFAAASGGPAIAYCPDVKRVPSAALERLRGVDTLVIDMLREKAHPTHMNLEESLAAVDAIAPRRTFFTHMAHEIDHATVEAKLPPSIRLAYDGLVLEVG